MPITMTITAEDPRELFSTIKGAAQLIAEDVPPAAPAAETVPNVVNPTPAPTPMPPVGLAAPAPSTPGPVPTTPTVAPTVNAGPASIAQVPTTAAPAYTLDQITAAGSALLDAGKMDELSALMQKYGVPALTSLPPEYYGAVATDLRAMGAKI